MDKTTMTLSEELAWRGFVQQSTLSDLSELDSMEIVFYHGFDASADSQTIGNLASMMLDRLFMRHGAKAIILAGGATSLIGDPGGKDVERPLQTEETIAHNVEKAKEQLKVVFKGYDFELVNNLDWTRSMTVLHFLREIGKHFSMTPLVQRDYIAQRMGEGGVGISYTEFSYTLLQGMDYLHLFDTYGCNLQIGGSDQWGNCISGVELVRKARGQEVHCITLPLVVNQATGKKFGKSEDGAVWLDESKTSVYRFYQFWLNIDDDGLEYYFKIYTELDRSEVEEIIQHHQENPSLRYGQKRLAREVTSLIHGESRANDVARMSDLLFGGQYNELTEQNLKDLTHELPTATVHHGASLVDFMIETNLASSKTEARRFLSESAVSLNGSQLPLDQMEFTEHDFMHGYCIVKRGKNSLALAVL